MIVASTLARFNDVIDLDDMVNEVPNILGSEGCKEESQVDFLDGGLGIQNNHNLQWKFALELMLLGMTPTQLPQFHLYLEVVYRVIPTQLAQNYIYT